MLQKRYQDRYNKPCTHHIAGMHPRKGVGEASYARGLLCELVASRAAHLASNAYAIAVVVAAADMCADASAAAIATWILPMDVVHAVKRGTG